MTWFADLSPCTYFAEGWAPSLRSIGWLERGQPFATGSVDPQVFARLVEFIKEPWQPITYMGVHSCDLCLYDDSVCGLRNLFIPAQGLIYVCPELIVHYMNAHWYQPPEEFCRAVLASPPMRSMEYLKALLANGGRGIVANHPSRSSM